MHIRILFAAALLAASPAWAINKCKGPDGKISFQDAPCPGQGEKIDVRPASGGVGEPGLNESLAGLKRASAEYVEAVKRASEARIQQINKVNADCDARSVKQLAIGMPAEDALCVPGWRFPSKFNNTKTETQFKQQVVYGGFGKYDDPPKYLYFENGKLVAIQE